MSTPQMRTIDDLARAVAAACERRGAPVSTQAALVASTEAVAPIAGNLGISVASVVARYVDEELVERIAAELIDPGQPEELQSPPMPDPGDDLLRLLMRTGSAVVGELAGLTGEVAGQAAMMAAVYGWMEGHIEGEDLCSTPAAEHAPVPALGEHPHPARVRDLLVATAQAVSAAGLFADPAETADTLGSVDRGTVPGVVPWPDPDAQALALVLMNALDVVAVPARSAAAPAAYAVAVAAWAAGHLQGHRCGGCDYRGSVAHARENAHVRASGGGTSAVRETIRGGSPLLGASDAPVLPRRT